MKWNKVIRLMEVVTATDGEGIPRESVASESTVFANARHMGMESWAAARSLGLHADSTVQVRSMEYDPKFNRCEVDGREYEVERSYDTGEYTTLTLKERLRNARG